MSITPRPFQVEDAEKVERAWQRGMRTPAVVWATGLGKTVLKAMIARRYIARTGRRVLVLAHRRELVEQARKKIVRDAPDLRVGVVMAGRNQTLHDVVVASPQTLAGLNRRRQLLDVGLVLVDEAHHYAAPSYRNVLQYFLEQGAQALGVTATMSRQDGLALGDVWQDVVATRDIRFGIENGYLVRPIGLRVKVDDLDLRTVRRQGGDYQPEALGTAVATSLAPKRVAEALQEHAPGESTVVFAPNIRAADVFAEELGGKAINYKTPIAERIETLQRHEAGDLQVVCNSMVLTEGWDNPRCSVAVIARPTSNSALWQQMVGRVLRTAPGKTRALVMDLVGVSEQLTLQAQIDLFGAEYAERPEREPCDHAFEQECTCPRNRCGVDCVCRLPGPRQAAGCGCRWAELEPAEVDDDGDLFVDGTLKVETVDLFGSSRSHWLQTRGGTWFLAARERFIAILPGERVGRWDVLAMHRTEPQAAGYSRWVMRDVSDLGLAQAFAEGDVTRAEKTTAARGRAWRGRPPTAAEEREARRWGVLRDGTAGDLVDAISVAQASWRVDEHVERLRRAQS